MNGLGTDTPRASPFTTPGRLKSRSETCKTEVLLAIKKDERLLDYVFQVLAHITWDI